MRDKYRKLEWNKIEKKVFNNYCELMDSLGLRTIMAS